MVLFKYPTLGLKSNIKQKKQKNLSFISYGSCENNTFVRKYKSLTRPNLRTSS